MATKKVTDTETTKKTTKAETAKKATKAAKAEKDTAKKATAVKAEKATTKKATAKAETATTKKATAKTAEVVLQFAGNQYSCNDIADKVKDAWKNQFKKKLKDFVNVQIYVKPEDNKAYFVVNGDASTEYFVEL